jgi:fumarate hydratase class II
MPHVKETTKPQEFVKIVKTRRTYLQDAAQLTVGQEISGWSSLIERDLQRIGLAIDGLFDLAMGDLR